MLVFELKDMVPDYNPSKELLHQMMDTDLGRLATALNSAQALSRSRPPIDCLANLNWPPKYDKYNLCSTRLHRIHPSRRREFRMGAPRDVSAIPVSGPKLVD